jgi:hypothetical protein
VPPVKNNLGGFFNAHFLSLFRSLSHTGPPSAGPRRGGGGGGPPSAGRGSRAGAGGGRVSAPVADIVEILQQQSGGAPRSAG